MNQDGVNRALMMKFGLLLIALGLCGLPGYGATSQHPAPPASPQPAAAMESKAPAGQRPAGAAQAEAHYVLTPEKRAKHRTSCHKRLRVLGGQKSLNTEFIETLRVLCDEA